MANRKRTNVKKNAGSLQRGSPVVVVRKVATDIRDLIESARAHVSVTANLAMVSLYWNIGRIITQDIQQNEKRAEYGATLLRELAGMLTQEYGEGYSRANLQDMRRFFESFEICQTASSKSSPPTIIQPLAGQPTLGPICQTASGKSTRREMRQTVSAESCDRLPIDFRKHYRLGWSHYRLLLSQGDPLRRKFYFEHAAQQRWSVRELRRQIDRGLFERVTLSRDTPRLVAQEKQASSTEVVRFEDIFKDPYVLDFLGLKGAYSEKDLEAAIVRNLEQFLTELGTDFCFIARQYAMRVDEDDYFLDLLFYHRGLRCLVAIDLKIGTFTAADKGQMDLYLAWLKEHDWRAGENEPVGLVLCTSARRQHVELLLRHGPHKMKVAEYQTQLPDKRLLEGRLKMYSKLLKDRDREFAE
ncbi:MAG TPA: PDDEXK nuclease domain-containing protein [Sedimentisphaerales bacterium]|nr:PDDEXK nuclease domain-containing protein [Sedimentisphaerales bacterium]